MEKIKEQNAPLAKSNSSQSLTQDAISAPSKVADSIFVQAKLETTSSDDQYEREADAMADIVTGKQANDRTPGSISSGKSSRVMPLSEMGGSSIAVPSSMENSLLSSQGGGISLPSSLQSSMEKGFGRNFSNVRIHADEESAQMNASIKSKAFTYGNDIYFNKGEYNPNTQEGKHLIAHELTHTVQQNHKVSRLFEDNYYGVKMPEVKDKKWLDARIKKFIQNTPSYIMWISVLRYLISEMNPASRLPSYEEALCFFVTLDQSFTVNGRKQDFADCLNALDKREDSYTSQNMSQRVLDIPDQLFTSSFKKEYPLFHAKILKDYRNNLAAHYHSQSLKKTKRITDQQYIRATEMKKIQAEQAISNISGDPLIKYFNYLAYDHLDKKTKDGSYLNNLLKSEFWYTPDNLIRAEVWTEVFVLEIKAIISVVTAGTGSTVLQILLPSIGDALEIGKKYQKASPQEREKIQQTFVRDIVVGLVVNAVTKGIDIGNDSIKEQMGELATNGVKATLDGVVQLTEGSIALAQKGIQGEKITLADVGGLAKDTGMKVISNIGEGGAFVNTVYSGASSALNFAGGAIDFISAVNEADKTIRVANGMNEYLSILLRYV